MEKEQTFQEAEGQQKKPHRLRRHPKRKQPSPQVKKQTELIVELDKRKKQGYPTPY